MLVHPIQSTQVPNTVAVLQLNCRRSPNILLSLFKDENIANFLFIILQEPPVNPHTNCPKEQQGWHLISHQPANRLEESRPRSCIYINRQFNPTIQPIDTQSRDVSACTVQLNKFEMLPVNVYNQPGTFKGFTDMETTLRSIHNPILLLPTVLVTDSNLHSAL